MVPAQVKRLLVKEERLAGTADQTRQYVGEITEDTLVDIAMFAVEGLQLNSKKDEGKEGKAAAAPSLGPVGQGWEIAYSEITMLSRIGQGSFGEVWHGRWRGTDVAVKRVWGLQGTIEEAVSAQLEFDREISLLSRLRHPNVVSSSSVVSQLLASPMRCFLFLQPQPVASASSFPA